MEELTELEQLDEQESRSLSADTEATELQPDWKNAPSLEALQADYTDAKSEHDSHCTDVAAWLDNLNITGGARIQTPKNRSSVQPKTIRKQAEWRYPAISAPFLGTKDIFNISPMSKGDRDRAYQDSMVLNYQFNHRMNKVSFIDECSRSLVDEGTVFVYTGWKLEEEEYEEEQPIFEIGPVQNEQEAMETKQLLQQYQADPETFKINQPDLLVQVAEMSMQNQAPMKAYISGSEVVTKTRTLANHPLPEVLDYRSVVPDPTCEGDIDKANFMVRLFESSQSELKKTELYSNLDDIRPSGARDADTGNETSFTFKDKARAKFEVVEYWGYWDINGDGSTVSIVAAWVGSTLIRLEENPMPGGLLPFESSQQLPQRKSNYGQPDGELIIDNQKIIGATVRGSIDIMAGSANGQIGSMMGALDPVNKAKFKRGDHYEYSPNSDPMKAFFMHKFPEIPQSAHIMQQSQQADAESMTGVRPFSQSQAGSVGSETAAGVKTATDASSLRNSDILRRYGEMMKRIGRKYLAMNQVFLTEEEVVRITNQPYVEPRQDDTDALMDLEITISTPEEDSGKAQELAFMLQTVGPKADPAVTMMLMADVARLRNMHDLADKLSSWEPPQPSEMEQQMQQMQMMKLQAEIEEIKSRTAENMAGAHLDQAKAGTEGAKAGNLKSDTDLKDLNFLEQESGTTQARSKEMVNLGNDNANKSKMFDAMDKRDMQDRQFMHDDIKDKQSAVGNPTVSTGLSQE